MPIECWNDRICLSLFLLECGFCSDVLAFGIDCLFPRFLLKREYGGFLSLRGVLVGGADERVVV